MPFKSSIIHGVQAGRGDYSGDTDELDQQLVTLEVSIFK